MIGVLQINGKNMLEQVAYADGFTARGRGWLGYEYTPLQGIWLPATSAVHTVGMRMALDLIWLDAKGVCCHIDAAVPPWRLRCHWRATSLIELRCGLLTNHKGEHFAWTQ